MSDESKSEQWSDEDLYARLATPYPSKDAASDAVQRFLDGVRKLREEFGVAEVVVLAAAHHVAGDDGATSAVQSLALGDSRYRAQLGATAYRIYTAPEIARAERLRAIARGDDGGTDAAR